MFIPEDISKRAEKYSAEYSPHDFYTTFIVSNALKYQYHT